MSKAAFGNEISSYHLEAAIAFEHCTAEDFEKTNWERILNYYESLCKIISSPITELNKVVAIMQVHGAEKALQELGNIKDKKKLEAYYLYFSLLGEIQSRLNNSVKAKNYFESAINLTQSETERKMLHNKIAALFN